LPVAQAFRKQLIPTPVQTFLLCPVIVFALEAVWRGG
jgi:hypothetical protein